MYVYKIKITENKIHNDLTRKIEALSRATTFKQNYWSLTIVVYDMAFVKSRTAGTVISSSSMNRSSGNIEAVTVATSQKTNICSKSTIESLEEDEKYVQI